MSAGEQLVAVVVVVVRDDRVLALRRAPHRDAGAGLWETVSGRVAPGEEPHDAAVREAREETGLEVRVAPRPVDAYAMRRAGRPMVVVVYRGDAPGGEVRRSEEHDDHAFCDVPELERRGMPARLVVAVRAALAAEAPSSPPPPAS